MSGLIIALLDRWVDWADEWMGAIHMLGAWVEGALGQMDGLVGEVDGSMNG